MKLTVIGCGYVGLTAAACLASAGSGQVVGYEIDRLRMEQLQAGICPINEPGLEELLQCGISHKRLAFTGEAKTAMRDVDIFLIAVGTPAAFDGSPNLNLLHRAVNTIAEHMTRSATVIIKSTIPPGGTETVRHWFYEALVQPDLKINLVYCPEFLREGNAVSDFILPQRIVAGGSDESAVRQAAALHQMCCTETVPVLYTTARNAELIKYASNSFLALKVAFINELARLCNKAGGEIDEVAHGMGLDSRISSEYLHAGIGYGGACLPKDIQGLTGFARTAGEPLPILEQVIRSNETHQERIADFIHENVPNGQVIGVWGLTFKAGSDDLRSSPSLSLIRRLADKGCYRFQLYDPTVHMQQLDQLCGVEHICAQTPAQAVQNTDALLIIVPWGEFQAQTLCDAIDSMHKKRIFDLCRLCKDEWFETHDVRYWRLGGRQNYGKD